jgi:hypothetical protein
MALAITEKITDNLELIDDVNADGSLWELTYNIKNSNCEYVEILWDYTKNASTLFTIQVAFSDINDVDGTFYKETIMDPSLLTIGAATFTEADAGPFRAIYPVGQVADKIKFIITPDVASGTDTIKVIVNELVNHGTR